MREALVEVLDDDARVVQHEVAVHQRRQLWYGIEVEQVFRETPGLTLTISISMPFSASTMRVRWLAGSSGAENSVMMDRRLDNQMSTPLIRGAARRAGGTRAKLNGRLSSIPSSASTQTSEHEQEQHDPDADATPLHLRGLAHVVEEVHGIAHETVVLLRIQPPGRDVLEVLDGLAGVCAASPAARRTPRS